MVQGELFARELLTGPAGCGKTHRILERYLAEVEAGREQQVLLLVPTASYREHTRNTALRSGRVDALLGRSVATFDGLVEDGHRPVLTGARRELIVRRLLRELDLPYLRQVTGFPGFRQALGEEAEEAIAAGLAADELERRARRLDPSIAFLKFLRLYEAATASFRQPVETEANPRLLLVDGFADFTAGQERLLETLVGRAAEAMVTLPPGSEPARRFLHRLGFRETLMEGNRRATGSLAELESRLRGGSAGILAGLQAAEGDERPARMPALPQDSAVAVFTAADRRHEVDRVAREILRLAGDERYRFSEIGVVVHNPEPYLPLVRDLFPRYGIPVRLFFPVTAPETALGRHLLACLDLFRDAPVRPEALLPVLKSPYSPILKREAVERFEYTVMENRAQVERGDWKPCLEKTHFPPLERFFVDLAQWAAELRKAEAGPEPALLARWTIGMWDAFTLLREVAPGFHPTAPKAGAAGAPGLSQAQALDLRADALAQARARQLARELAEAAEAENERLDFPAFAELLAAEMCRDRFRVRDRRHDAVNVMNPYEARQWELRAVFVVGLVEQEFPRPAAPALFLEEDDRQRLGLPTARERAAEEQRLFYTAATRARERLFLSHPATNGRGKPLLQSFFLDFGVRELAPAFLWPAAEPAQEPPRPAPPSDKKAAASRRTPKDFLELPAVLARLREEQVRFSASQFKNFAQCPFRHFAGNILRLQGPPEAGEGLTPILQGTIIHETLREWEWGGRAEPIEQVFERSFEAATEGIPITHAEEKVRYQMREDLVRFAAAESGHDSVYRTRVDPALLEKRFGSGDGPVLAWTLSDGATIQITGRLDRVEIALADGKRLGVVVDFKYSKDGFDSKKIGEVEKGQEFQIPLYLMVLEELLGLEPAGAELFRLKGEPHRAGVFHSERAKAVFCGTAPPETVLLPPEKFRALLETAKKKMEECARRIRDGEIAVRPEKTDQCRKGGCDFYDLCRVEKWQFLKS